ncbi:MAG: cytidine deaminase [Candidatus Diapherotrites archaeon]
MSVKERQLVMSALQIIRANRLDNKSLSCSVGCALIAGNGKVYRGVNIENYASAPVSICAETAAIAGMFADGERRIEFIVAVHMPDRQSEKWNVIQPCGACRHIIGEFGNPWVAISNSRKARLSQLYPLPVKKK